MDVAASVPAVLPDLGKIPTRRTAMSGPSGEAQYAATALRAAESRGNSDAEFVCLSAKLSCARWTPTSESPRLWAKAGRSCARKLGVGIDAEPCVAGAVVGSPVDLIARRVVVGRPVAPACRAGPTGGRGTYGPARDTWPEFQKTQTAVGAQKALLSKGSSVERVTGIEPAWPAWKAGALPLSYTRMLAALDQTRAAAPVIPGHSRRFRTAGGATPRLQGTPRGVA